MAIQTFSALKANMDATAAGSVSAQDLHDVVDTLEDVTTQDVVIKTASYTAVPADNRRKFCFDSTTPVTFIVASDVPPGWESTIAQIGTGAVTIGVTGGTTASKGFTFTTAGQYSVVYVFCMANPGSAPFLILTGDTAPGTATTRAFSNGMSPGFG